MNTEIWGGGCFLILDIRGFTQNNYLYKEISGTVQHEFYEMFNVCPKSDNSQHKLYHF